MLRSEKVRMKKLLPSRKLRKGPLKGGSSPLSLSSPQISIWSSVQVSVCKDKKADWKEFGLQMVTLTRRKSFKDAEATQMVEMMRRFPLEV